MRVFSKDLLMKKSGQQEIPWIRQALTSDGTMGGSDYACFQEETIAPGTNAYYAFDNIYNDANSTARPRNGHYLTLIYYSPIPVRATSATVCAGSASHGFGQVTVSGSNDNSNYVSLGGYSGSNVVSFNPVTIYFSTSNFYKYFKFYCYLASGTYTPGVSEINFSGYIMA